MSKDTAKDNIPIPDENGQNQDSHTGESSYPGNDPAKSPGDGWEWEGKGTPSDGKGNWTNPQTGESLHPDLEHPEPYGPHWNYKDPNGDWYRIFPDATKLPK